MAVIYAARLPHEPRLASCYPVVARVCVDPLGYWRGLANLWGGPFPLVIVEHDMQVSDPLVAALLACPHPLCTHAYRMHIPRTYYAHGTRADGMDGFWIDERTEWATYSGIGFCKIAEEARVRPLERTTWQGVELAVNNATEGRWHIHWGEVEHYHR